MNDCSSTEEKGGKNASEGKGEEGEEEEEASCKRGEGEAEEKKRKALEGWPAILLIEACWKNSPWSLVHGWQPGGCAWARSTSVPDTLALCTEYIRPRYSVHRGGSHDDDGQQQAQRVKQPSSCAEPVEHAKRIRRGAIVQGEEEEDEEGVSLPSTSAEGA
ncbi:hypothetical protein TRV_02348 [Trichophyton verrucosum HKI 0517]|uniref:Uncharacterized protein n=1 Tax=Trichophyton verrucosum (strain HKI 0517) TaxID=663202 RepID=D4D5H8_TRIVH|nr:uncharacterized protein TRV_02348 [Trichophyton verrucosum HKI 0517]EFE42880.1 hypothetical protein TRV_02348 [Trichophyton verrucosum HKI 0517]